MAQPRPFDFVDFDAKPQKAADQAQRFDAAALAAARAEGFNEGRRQALETIAADDAAALRVIGDRLAEAAARLDAETEHARAGMSAIARVFLEEFCATIADVRVLGAADDLLRRLTENSEDRRSARLLLGERHFERLEARLHEMLSARRIGDFVAIDCDPALKPGECRLEWRGGEISRTRAEIAAAVAALFDHADDQTMEPQS